MAMRKISSRLHVTSKTGKMHLVSCCKGKFVRNRSLHSAQVSCRGNLRDNAKQAQADIRKGTLNTEPT
ncbi:hypothetical protein C6500_17480 [Candidatus Poribacteria bacterium]|nr:MAG: hypothetical protein C6500_17480 [Candidatus Poribacteria bacterium]